MGHMCLHLEGAVFSLVLQVQTLQLRDPTESANMSERNSDSDGIALRLCSCASRLHTSVISPTGERIAGAAPAMGKQFVQWENARLHACCGSRVATVVLRSKIIEEFSEEPVILPHACSWRGCH